MIKASTLCPYCGGAGTDKGPEGHNTDCPAARLARADRRSAAREGVVKALDAFLDAFGAYERTPNPSGHPDPSGTFLSPAAVPIPTEIAESARAALKEYQEAN